MKKYDPTPVRGWSVPKLKKYVREMTERIFGAKPSRDINDMVERDRARAELFDRGYDDFKGRFIKTKTEKELE